MEKCPNNCVDGWYIDPYSHKKCKCLFCAEKRGKEIKTKSMSDLGLPEGYTNIRFQPETVILDSEKKVMSVESVQSVEAQMAELVSGIAVGELPSESILFNLGAKVIEQNLLYHIIAKGYIAGLKTLPLVEVSELMRSRALYERGESAGYKDYLSADVCVVSIDAGTDYNGLLAIKGLMQARARRNKPTIMLTHVWNKHVMNLCNTSEDFRTYELARCYSVQYTGKQGGTPRYQQGAFQMFQEKRNLL